MVCISDRNDTAPSSLRISTHNHPYNPATSSPASSSSSSVFSIDAPSSKSSAPSSSTDSLNAVWENESDVSYFSSRYHHQQVIPTSSTGAGITSTCPTKRAAPRAQPPRQLSEAVAPESRQHPRRTQRLTEVDPQKGGSTTSCPRPPPSLIRQCERKDNFVDSLVDTTTQMIETIWPLSILSCDRDAAVGGKNQNLIGLRTFVQEVLRRSKTSYSTLQVALYYLVLIQSCLPNRDFTMEQLEDTQSCRAMQCGRRMFLAALILASKYLQDRNFSARAWSKISGLRTCEINTNEMAFLSAVNWKLHIPEPVFHRWNAIVLKYSPSAQSSTSPRSSPSSPTLWKSMIPLLTPDLDDLDVGAAIISIDSGYNSPGSEMDSPPPLASLKVTACSESNEQTPTNPYTIPRVLEPALRDFKVNEQILPPLPRLGPLPTPIMTPQTSNFSTPAVGADGLCPRRSSMSVAMAQANNACLSRVILDPHPSSTQCSWKPTLPEPFSTSGRRSSFARSSSSLSSPESMVSDLSSRSSRSSSISSVASSTSALPQPRLAVQATRRCAKMQLPCLKEHERPVPRIVDSDQDLSWEAFSQRSTPHKGSNRQPWEPIWAFPDAIENSENDHFAKSRKPQPNSHPENLSTTHSASTHEAAAALRDLALNRGVPANPIIISLSPRSTPTRKRERPPSMDLSHSTQERVRELIAPRCLGDITNGVRNGDDGTVLQDSRPADSFLMRNENCSGMKTFVKERGSRKRACAGKDEERRLNRTLAERSREPGPGMWEGII